MKRIGTMFLALCLVMVLFSACKTDDAADGTTDPRVTVNHDLTVSGQAEAGIMPPATAAPGTEQKETEPPATKAKPTEREQVSVTIPEGYTFMQVAQKLEAAGVCSAADFYTTSQNYTVKSFTIPSSPDRCFKMEGYLYPDTYTFYINDDPEDVLRKMLNNYAAKSGMPSDQTLILASIIEKEVRSSSHMSMVSSVFHNRLEQGMKLQSDATREYVNRYITGNSLLGDTSKYAALYNTYKCAALPAGPICNPSSRAIQAAQSYEDTDYLYFFFGQDNDNHYSKTLEEHEAQIAQYGVG